MEQITLLSRPLSQAVHPWRRGGDGSIGVGYSIELYGNLTILLNQQLKHLLNEKKKYVYFQGTSYSYQSQYIQLKFTKTIAKRRRKALSQGQISV